MANAFFPREGGREIPHLGKWGRIGKSFDHYWKYDFGQHEQVAQLLTGHFAYLRSLPRPAVVIDYLATPEALIDFQQTRLGGHEMRGIAVGYGELPQARFSGLRRSSTILVSEVPEDVTYISGDLRDPNTCVQVTKALQGKKADFIMERGLGGLHFLPSTLEYGRQAISSVWSQLTENGVAVLQTPPFWLLTERGIDMQGWLAELEEKGVTYAYNPMYASEGFMYGLLALKKKSETQLLPEIKGLM